MYGRPVFPAMWWRHRERSGECGAEAGCGPGGGGGYGHGRRDGGGGGGGESRGYWAAPGGHDDFGGGPFGVRRPLRFLAHKLDLSDDQVAELATILNDLKTERAQAAVDDRRVVAAFADAVAGESFDDAKVKESAAARVASAERLRDAVVTALGRIHAVLDAEQRKRLAYLIRTGVLSI